MFNTAELILDVCSKEDDDIVKRVMMLIWGYGKTETILWDNKIWCSPYLYCITKDVGELACNSSFYKIWVGR